MFARSALYLPPDTPNGGLWAYIWKRQFKSKLNIALCIERHYMVREKKIVDNIYFYLLSYGGHFEFFSIIQNAQQLQSATHRIWKQRGQIV